jgi:hypothetical protein
MNKVNETGYNESTKFGPSQNNPPYISDDFQIGPDGAYEHIEEVQPQQIERIIIMNKLNKTYTDPFLGEIELLKVGETSMHLMGESVVHTIYIDKINGHYYIDTWTTTGGDPIPMKIIPKRVIDKIIENEKLPNGK